MKKHIGAAIIALTLGASGASAQDDAASTHDLQCMALALAMSGSNDPGQQAAGRAITMYYLGRLDGREPGLDLENRFIAAVSSLTEADEPALRTSCGTEVQSRGVELQQVGARIAQRGAAMGR